MARSTERLSFIEKTGYSLGDAAANFVFMTMILFQLNFYTDTMGITAAAAGTMLLVGRLWDAFFDPMMGVLADRTNTRWGKFRPWVLWTALPWGVVMVLAYTVPSSFGTTSKIVYAVLTNILLMTLYSANNTPYSAMSGVMTGDSDERTVLSSYRFVAAMLAQLIVGGFTLPLVAKFGHGNNAVGWQKTMTLWAVVCVVCFVITFLTTKERIAPPPQQKSEPRADFKNLLKNGPWIAMFVLTLSHFIFVAMRGGTMFYYFSYYVDKAKLLEFLQGARPAAGHGGVARRRPLPDERARADSGGGSVERRVGGIQPVQHREPGRHRRRRRVVDVPRDALRQARGGARRIHAHDVLLASFIFMPATSIGATYTLELVRALCYAPTIPLLWAMFADIADYAEWKTGRRTTGVVFATILFALKTGLSLGGAIAGWLLSGYGYQPNTTQTEHALLGIRLTVSVYPAIFLVIVVVCLVRYRITRAVEAQMALELDERRRGFTAGVSAPGLPDRGGAVVASN